MKKIVAVAGLAIVLTACGAKDKAPAEAGGEGEAAAPVETETGADAGTSQKRLPLPACDALTDDEVNDRGKADCRLMSSDAQGLAFEVRYSDAEDATAVTIEVVAPGDATLQTIEELDEGSYGPPELMDLDADGRDELLVPLMTGNVNTVYAIWRATGEETEYTRIAEVSGFPNPAPFGDGIFSFSARSSAASYEVDHMRFGEDATVTVATAMIEMVPTGDGPDDYAEECDVVPGPGFDELEVPFEEARARFCGTDE